MGDFTMPSLGADMEEGTVIEWLVKPGDEVHRGDVVAVVETEKSTIEVEIFESGVIDELIVQPRNARPGRHRPRPRRHPGARRGPDAAATFRHAGSGPGATNGDRGSGPDPRMATGRTPGGPPPTHSPVVRHLAEQLGVDLAALTGSGPGGTVTRADVEQAAMASGSEALHRQQAGRKIGAEAAVEGKRRPARRTRSSPRARRLAAELGVDLSAVTGSGPGGSVVEKDVELAASRAPAATPSEQVARATTAAPDRQDAMRRAIGALMARSKREIPHYYLSTTIDVGAAVSWLERANLERPVTSRLVLPVLLLKATARAVARVHEMNGFFVDDGFVPSEAVHVGVAVSLRSGGVIAPAIHHTDQLAVDELMVKLHDLVGRARTGVLRSSEMSDPTITVTNLGDLGVEAVFGVIYPPQVALVGFGRVTERAVANHGMLGVRPCVTATLSADHRASDGHRGGRFLAEIDRLLQEPEGL